MKQITPENRHSLTVGLPAALSRCWVLAVHTSICIAPDDNNLGKKTEWDREGKECEGEKDRAREGQRDRDRNKEG